MPLPPSLSHTIFGIFPFLPSPNSPPQQGGRDGLAPSVSELQPPPPCALQIQVQHAAVPSFAELLQQSRPLCSKACWWLIGRSRANQEPSSARMIGAAPEPGRPLFVLFGSSIVQYGFSNGGWGAALVDIYARKADIILRGYIGWNSRRALQVIDKVFPKDSQVQPSLVIVYFGGNDSIAAHSSGLGPHVPLEEYIDNMRKIAEHLKSLSEKTRVIFLSCPPLNEEMLRKSTSTALSEIVRTNETCRLYSEACISVCKEMDLKVVDLWNAMQKRDDWATACFTDGLHLSEEGSNIVVEEILTILKEADWEPCLHWKAMPTEFGEDSPYDLVSSSGKSTINPSEWTFHRRIAWD